MGKYDPLRAYLSALSSDVAELSFAEVEGLVGSLPKAARFSSEWWANGSAVQARAWRAAGWHVKSADQGRELVTFARRAAADTQEVGPALAGFRHDAPGTSGGHAAHEMEVIPASSSGDTRAEGGKRWPVLAAAVVSATGAAAVTIVGLAVLPRWAIFLTALDLSAVLTLITSALTDAKYRVVSLWVSNGLLIALIAGIAIYNLVPQYDITVNVVPNTNVTLSYQAGSVPDVNDPNSVVLPAGKDETATCYSAVNGKVWLYFHFSDEQAGWAPFSDFHYDPGLAHSLPSSCT